MQLPENYPPILADIAHLLRLRLSGSLPDAQADRLARACADDIGLTYSKCQIYIPAQDAALRAQRDAAIWEEFNGSNHLALSRKYHMTLSTIYGILARQRQQRRQQLQDPLF